MIPPVDLEAEQAECREQALALIAGRVRDPDMYVNMLWMDKGVRDQENIPYPFPGQNSKRWQGCYLMIDGEIAIYAGQSAYLGIRLHQHWSEAPSACFGLRYWDMVDRLGLDGAPFAAIWLIPEKRDRNNFEHLLLGTFTPLLNRI